MRYSSIKNALSGVGFTLPTPFDDHGKVASEELRNHVQGLCHAGAELLIPCGNTGEYYALSRDERVEVVNTTVDAADDDTIIVGGAGGSVPEVLDLAEAYEAAGADAVMVMSPSHVYSQRAGMIEYYRRILEGTDLGVVIYRRGPLVTNELIAELSTVENLVGVKFAVDDVDEFSRAVRRAEGDVTWVNGIAERFAPTFALEGADGFTTGIGNFVPEATLALADALDAGNWDRAIEIRDLLRPLEDIRQESVGGPQFGSAKNVPVVKHGVGLRGWYGGPVRPPLEGLSDADEQRVEEYYERVVDADL